MKQLRFVFIACNKNPHLFMSDPSFIYRCENLAFGLKALGHKVELLHYTQLHEYDHYDVAIFHRPSYRFLFNWELRKLKRKGCILIADFDDLVFAPEYAYVSPGVINGLVTPKQTEKNFRSHARALKSFDKLTTSTQPLVQALQKSQPHSQILFMPNSTHMTWRQRYENSCEVEKEKILTYFPGTRSHDKDFSTITTVLAEFLHEQPHIRLHITGVLNCELKCRPNQLIQQAKVPFADYPRYVAKSWVNLAPLAMNEFNLHKSGIKAIEAAFFNSPTVASPIPDMQRLSTAGALLADTPDAWFAELTKLCQPDYYSMCTQQLKETSIATADILQQAQRFVQFIGEK